MQPAWTDAIDEKGSLIAYKTPWFLNVRAGWHIMRESTAISQARSDLVASHIFFQGEQTYFSNAQTPVIRQNQSAPVLNIEVATTIQFDRIPGFRSIKSLSKSKNFRIGAGMSYYPKMGRDTQIFEGLVTYSNRVTADPALQTMNYQAQISAEENFFSLVPEMSLYYQWPRIGKDSGRAAVFMDIYTGITSGFGILSGKRKITMTSTDLIVNSRIYNANANYQDTIIDGLGLKTALSLGTFVHIKDGHFVDIRFSYVWHETNAAFTRSGYWNETEKDAAGNLGYTIARRNINEEVRYRFDQGGILITAGYSARLK
ncbi:hypothetical protein [Turneriella parva]|nr:hypothetical protein [Turneriella parva]